MEEPPSRIFPTGPNQKSIVYSTVVSAPEDLGVVPPCAVRVQGPFFEGLRRGVVIYFGKDDIFFDREQLWRDYYYYYYCCYMFRVSPTPVDVFFTPKERKKQ